MKAAHHGGYCVACAPGLSRVIVLVWEVDVFKLAMLPGPATGPAQPWRWRAATTLLVALLSAAGLPLQAQAQQPGAAARYAVWLPDGSQAGALDLEAGADGEQIARYRYKNNGRGPETVERYRLAADGTPLAYQVTGSSTFGSLIDEQFQRQGERASWRSAADAGEGAATGPALYAAMGGSPLLDVIAVPALARAPQRSLPLWPSGSLRQQVLDRLTVQQPGASLALQLLAHTGLGFEPTYLWATDEPTPRLFASLYPGYYHLVQDGWQTVLPQLLARQLTAEATLHRQRAADWRRPLPGLTVVRNARVFDSQAARLGPAMDVYVHQGRITAVLPAGRTAAQAPDTEIDAAGRVMLPGLFDMHDHAWRGGGGLHLAAGVTTTRDMGSDNAQLQKLMGEMARGELAYPQVVPAGLIEGESPFSLRLGILIKTLDQARDAVDWYAQRGYPQIKIYNSFPRELLADIVAHAHARGLRVSGHVPAFMRAEEVVRLGFDEVQHVNQLLLNFLVTPSTDTRTLERFTLPAERLGELDLDSAPVQAFIRLLKDKGTVVDLTLMTFQFLQQRDGEEPAELAGVLPHLPPDVQRGSRMASMKIPDDATARRYRAAVAKLSEFAGRLYQAGVPLVAGTDSLSGIVLHSELIGYVKAGLTPAQALQVATRNGARYTGTEADRGAITPGRRADLILLDGEPTENIADIRKVALVITQGHWIAPRQVHEALGIKPFVDATPVVRSLAGPN